ncbi:MAG: replication initiation protein [Bacteroidales bacterium]|nr:replication initiation protein [Bacteroidales bacterium]
MTKDVELHENNQIVKANKLIEAKGRLSLLEQKLFASLVSEITPEDRDFKTYYLEIKHLAEFTGTKSKDIYEDLKQASRHLIKNEILIEKENDDGTKSFLVTGLFSSAQHKDGSGILEIQFDPNLKPYLLAINGKNTPFTKYMLKNILKLSSAYSIRIYELLKQYLKAHRRKFEMTELRAFLGVEDKYKRFEAFERRILKVAKEEINEHTDIDIDYEKIKHGRRITHIEFSIRSTVVDEEIKVLDRLYSDEEYQIIVDKMNLNDKKLNRKQVFKLYEIACSKTDHLENVDVYDYVKMNNEYVKRKSPDNYYAYLRKALENDYEKALDVLRNSKGE